MNMSLVAFASMESTTLDMLMVPSGLMVMVFYHVWLLYTIHREPKRTVIGLNAIARQRWVAIMMDDPGKNAILAVQTLRNNIMASTLLGTTAITLTSLISVFAGLTSPGSSLTNNKNSPDTSFKFFAISVCFFVAFLCHVQSIRHYAHVSFLVTVVSCGAVSAAYVARSLNRGSIFWSIGLRAFHVSFTLFLWIFGPIPMFVSCVLMCIVLYYLDLATESTGELPECFNVEENYYIAV